MVYDWGRRNPTANDEVQSVYDIEPEASNARERQPSGGHVSTHAIAVRLVMTLGNSEVVDDEIRWRYSAVKQANAM